MNDQYSRKRREPCVLFLDDCFDATETPAKLLKAGFYRVESFLAHFRRADGTKLESVKDPQVIRLCNRNKWLLVTTDSELRVTHIEEIKKATDLAILATSHNSVQDIDIWVDALIRAKAAVEREFKNRQRPWYAQFNRQGKLTTIYTIGADHSTRRSRPREINGPQS